MSERKEATSEKPRSKRYRKDKPWDTDDIDHWKIEEWKDGDMSAPLLEESSFATLFPKYREDYLKENWATIEQQLKGHGIKAELNLIEGSMTVRTTRKTSDPYLIMKARDLIKLLARSIPMEKAFDILKDDVNCDIIKIGNLVRNKDRFIRRRQRLIGPKGQTLKAIELLTKCYIFIQGNTVAAMGSFKGLKQVRRLVVECIQDNYHPIYNIKKLMIIRELEKDPNLKHENWDRFLPKFRKINPKKTKDDKSANATSNNKKRKRKEKKPYTPFPPLPTKSKIDLQLESGEYFLNEMERKRKYAQEKQQKKKVEKAAERKRKRDAMFVPPEEPPAKHKRG